MKCPKCKQELIAGNKFCTACGSSAPAASNSKQDKQHTSCPFCNTILEPLARACGNCGEVLVPFCPECKAITKWNWKKCPYCKADLPFEETQLQHKRIDDQIKTNRERMEKKRKQAEIDQLSASVSEINENLKLVRKSNKLVNVSTTERQLRLALSECSKLLQLDKRNAPANGLLADLNEFDAWFQKEKKEYKRKIEENRKSKQAEHDRKREQQIAQMRRLAIMGALLLAVMIILGVVSFIVVKSLNRNNAAEATLSTMPMTNTSTISSDNASSKVDSLATPTTDARPNNTNVSVVESVAYPGTFQTFLKTILTFPSQLPAELPVGTRCAVISSTTPNSYTIDFGSEPCSYYSKNYPSSPVVDMASLVGSLTASQGCNISTKGTKTSVNGNNAYIDLGQCATACLNVSVSWCENGVAFSIGGYSVGKTLEIARSMKSISQQ